MTATGVPVGYAEAPPVASADVASATAANVRVAGQEDVPGQVRDESQDKGRANQPMHVRMPYKHPPP